MLQHRVTPGASSPAYSDVVNTMGNLDYIKNDALYRNQGTPTVMVTAETGLIYDTEVGTGTEYTGTEWTLYCPYKDRVFTF